jgi:hypothetical protein
MAAVSLTANSGFSTAECLDRAMRTWLLASTLFVGSKLLAAIAPDSVAGLVYHDHLGNQLREHNEVTVVLHADSTYHFLKFIGGTILQGPKMDFRQPPRDGTYTYQRTGEATGTLVLSEPNGTLPSDNSRTTTGATTMTLALVFQGSRNGSMPTPDDRAGISFYFTDEHPTPSPPLANTAMRGIVSPGHPLIVGFVTPPKATDSSQWVEVLVRVVGPTLSRFAMANPWQTPSFTFTLSNGYNAPALFAWTNASATPWSSIPAAQETFERLAAYVGAFPLDPGSRDAAAILRLPPGAWTIVASATGNDPGGDTLIEVYTLP